MCYAANMDSLRLPKNVIPNRVFTTFFRVPSREQALDVIELTFKFAIYAYKKDRVLMTHARPSITPEEAVKELNARFKEHGIGYQFESDEVVRVDSQLLHQEAVKPTLFLLKEARFQAANEEFLKAHDHYRHGQHSEAINECLKALESTLKVICTRRKWAFDEKHTAKNLLDVVFAHELMPNHLESTFGGLRAVLENAVPTTRNRMSAHGAGVTPKDIPPYVAGYVLHVTASSILFLVEADKQLLQ
jgi:hypothetical protein